MTILDSIKKQFIDVIEWVEEDDATLTFRYPMRDREIQYGAMLTVRESQMAVFVNEGRIADVFGPGLYKLTTRTIPVLTALKNWDKLFESPFKSDVMFFSTRLRVDQKWGTANPLTIRDADFGAVRLRAYGNYTFRIADAAVFHRHVSGTVERTTVDDVAGQLRTAVVSGLTDLFGESKVPFLDLASRLDELAAQLRGRLAPAFAALGLELSGFAVENVSLPEELQKVLDQRIGMNMAGDIAKFTQFNVGANIGTAMTEAAANPSGLAGIGAGLGAGLSSGMAMAQAMSQAMAPSTGAGQQQTHAQATVQGGAQAVSSTGNDVTDLIAKLHDLKTRGAITEAEFEAKKKELLARIGR